jgi:hypothetical protein
LGRAVRPAYGCGTPRGRAHIAKQPDHSWDAIVIDTFLGARVPARLITVEAFTDAARVVPLTLINIVDNRSARL